MAEREQKLKRWHTNDEIVRKLDQVSDIGILMVSTFTAAAGKPGRVASGRQLSAWLGMTPREFSNVDRRTLGHISRLGSVYTRKLLTHGSGTALIASQRCQARTS